MPCARSRPCEASCSSSPRQKTTNAHCAIAPPIATLFACVVYANASRRSGEGWPRIPDPERWREAPQPKVNRAKSGQGMGGLHSCSLLNNRARQRWESGPKVNKRANAREGPPTSTWWLSKACSAAADLAADGDETHLINSERLPSCSLLLHTRSAPCDIMSGNKREKRKERKGHADQQYARHSNETAHHRGLPV